MFFVFASAFATTVVDLAPSDAIPIADDQATIVFVRPGNMGFAIKPAILDGTGAVLGESRAKSWFPVQVEPGDHTFVSWGEGTPTMKATVEAGEVYFVLIDLRSGGWTARFHPIALGPTRDDWGKIRKWMKKARPMTVNQASADALARLREDDIQVVLQKSQSTWTRYSAEKKAEHAIGPDDGVTAVP